MWGDGVIKVEQHLGVGGDEGSKTRGTGFSYLEGSVRLRINQSKENSTGRKIKASFVITR